MCATTAADSDLTTTAPRERTNNLEGGAWREHRDERAVETTRSERRKLALYNGTPVARLAAVAPAPVIHRD